MLDVIRNGVGVVEAIGKWGRGIGGYRKRGSGGGGW